MDFDRVKNITLPGWALVVAGAAFGGAVLHQSRLLGGLIVGGLAFAFAYHDAPCCAGCAGKTTGGCVGGNATNTSAQPAPSASVGIPTMTATGTLIPAATQSSRPLPADYIGTAGPASTNPLDLWAPPKFGGGASSPAPSSGCKGCSS